MGKFEKGNKLATGGARPNAGRTPNAIREAAAEHLAEGVETLGDIAADQKAKDADRIAAVRALHTLVGKEGPAAKGPPKDEELVALFLRLKSPHDAWPPTILTRYLAGMVPGFPPPSAIAPDAASTHQVQKEP